MSEQLHDEQAEVALLGACLQSKNARIEARKIITGADFWRPAREAVYAAMTALDRAGSGVDLVTVRAALARQFEGAGDRRTTLTTQLVSAEQALIECSGAGVPDHVTEYATIVHRWALRRLLAETGRGLTHRALNPSEQPERIAAQAVTMLTGLRDRGAGDVTALSLAEMMQTEDDSPRWVIPGLLEAGDRLMLTGSEGAGKSALSRQLAVMAAAGLHPFTETVMPPIRALIIDAENKDTQVKRQTRPLLDWIARNGRATCDPTERVLVDALYPRRINLTSDRDLSRVHQAIDAWQADLVVLGPIYRMSPRALQTDDEAHPFLAALDTICERGCALVVEAHAGHATEGVGRTQARSLRPRGSSALLGWPEFGLGLRGLGGGIADLEPWRGHREQRAWPVRLRRAPGNRWVETHPDDRPPPVEPPPYPEPEGDGTLDQGVLIP